MIKYLLLLSILGINIAAHAQLCDGSLGDPVVKIDFGSGTSTHGSALGSSITSYTYTTADFPGDGYYTIESTTNTPGTWWTTTDHTGGGYMMVVNASLSVTDYFYKNTVTDLCPETTYEFAAWIMNLLRNTDNSLPNITFTIEQTDGTVLNTYNTGDIAKNSSAVWTQYGFYFTTPANISTVVIRMRNNKAGAAPGNDIALDDITFRPCGPTVTAVLSTGDTTVQMCAGATTAPVISGTVSSGYSSPSYQWQMSADGGTTWTDIAGATSASFTIPTSLTEGNYLFRLTVANGTNISSASCRIASNQISVIVNASSSASSNNPTCAGETLELYATGSSSYTYSWTGPNGFASSQQNPAIDNITTANNGTYYLSVSGYCSAYDSVVVNVQAGPMPNAGSDVAICLGDSTVLQGSVDAVRYWWSPAATLSDSTILNPVAKPLVTTAYVLYAANELCVATDTVVVSVWATPEANAGPDKFILKNTTTVLEGVSNTDGVSIAWTPDYNISATNILQPTVHPDVETTYTLTLTSDYGCGTDSDEAVVKVYDDLSIPNVFSPNGDGINDTWHILQLSNYPTADVTVFNRYGQQVFKSIGYTQEWDGKHGGNLVPVGTYYYVIDLKLDIPFKYTGWVEVLH
ncbi:MAG: gliding motility-associated C-terminal domain-containing protein [Edaphocola sp.]